MSSASPLSVRLDHTLNQGELSLSFDILAEIVGYARRSHLSVLRLVSRDVHTLATPRLYSQVEFLYSRVGFHASDPAASVFKFLNTIVDKPHLGSFTRSLTIRIDDQDSARTRLFAIAVRSMQNLRHLDLNDWAAVIRHDPTIIDWVSSHTYLRSIGIMDSDPQRGQDIEHDMLLNALGSMVAIDTFGPLRLDKLLLRSSTTLTVMKIWGYNLDAFLHNAASDLEFPMVRELLVRVFNSSRTARAFANLECLRAWVNDDIVRNATLLPHLRVLDSLVRGAVLPSDASPQRRLPHLFVTIPTSSSPANDATRLLNYLSLFSWSALLTLSIVFQASFTQIYDPDFLPRVLLECHNLRFFGIKRQYSHASVRIPVHSVAGCS